MKRSSFWSALFVLLTRSAIAATCSSDTFISAAAYPVQYPPLSIVTGDFNNDGFPDVATLGYSYYNLQSVTVLLGNPDGTFQTPVVTNVANLAGAMVAGLFDGDANLDLVLSRYDGSITMLPGNGDGSFTAPVTSTFPPNTPNFEALVAGNLDAGGTLDLAGVRGDATVSTLLGNGDGTFAAPQVYSASVSVNALALGDVNGDGELDAVANGGSNLIAILPGNGDGSFGPSTSVVGGASLNDVHLADFDGDGTLDIAVASGAFLAVLLGNGDGTFQAAHDYAAGTQPRYLGIGDFNGDGIADVAAANVSDSDAPPAFWILQGLGDGSFLPRAVYLAAPSLSGMVVGSFGGALGVASADGNAATVSALIGNGDGTLQAVKAAAFSAHPASLARGPFNADAFPDLAAGEGSTLSIFLGDGNAGFVPGQVITVPNGVSAVSAGDFTTDAVEDLITVGVFSGSLSFLAGNGDGTFQEPQTIGSNGYGYGPFLAVGDFDGDGFLDFAVSSNQTLEIYPGDGNGAFGSPLSSPLPFAPASGIAVDLNGDFKLDLVLANGVDCCYGSNTVTVLIGNGDGTFQAPATYGAGASPTSVAAGDFDGDGKIDLATANVGDSTVSILPGNGDGTFSDPLVLGLGWRPRTIVATDFDGDGHFDIVTANRDSDNAAVFRGLGAFQFASPVAYTVGGSPVPMVLVDLYANGAPDVVIGSTQGLGGVAMLVSPRLSIGTLSAFGACVGSAAHLDGNAAGFGPLTYQWRKNGVPLSDGSAISGSQTPHLTIDPASTTDDGSYDLAVTDSCTTASSNATTLSVTDPPPMPAIALGGPVAPGFPGTASVAAVAGHTYTWTLTGAVIVAGQGSPDITFLALLPGTMTLQVVDYAAPNCGTASGAIEAPVDYFDVPPSNPFHDDVVTIARAGVTAGCGGGNYCPTSPVTRAQMAVFLLKAELGADHVPPVYAQIFNDVPPGSFAYDWINELFFGGITGGCGNNDYCPDASVTRAQMSVFLLKTLVGGYYNPSYGPQIFDDVPQYSFAANFIGDLYSRGITGGCSASPLLYCPDSTVNRGQMAAFLVRTFFGP
jgi:hypothetical protein